jgi:putative ABC transport system permease protein
MNRSFSLLSNYLKIGARYFYRNRMYTILNLLGLSVGFAVFIFACSYVYFETNFESFHTKANIIYRATLNDSRTHWARIPLDYINELPNDVAGVKTLIRFQNHARKYVRVGSEKFKPTHAYVTDKEVFSVFDFKLVDGDPSMALAEPHSIVISQSLAKKYFGEQDPMGKDVFVIGDLDKAETPHRVTGIMEDLSSNTHLPVDLLISFQNKAERSGWAYTYILLDEGASISQVEKQMPGFIKKYSTPEEAKTDRFVFQALSDIHLTSTLAREIVPNGKVFYVRLVGFAGVLILLIAVINFMNLNSAMSLGRAKEVGMRKVLGANRGQLTLYLITESVAYNVSASVIGGIIAYLVFPSFQGFITIQFLPDPWLFTGVIAGIALTLGFAAGVYPVLLLTSLKPIAVLKTAKALTFAGKEKPFSVKRVMVTLQFAISIVLLGSALIAYNQFRYLRDKNPGMQRDQVIAIPGVPDQVKDKFETFRSRLAGQQGIAGVTACMEVPSREIRDAGPTLVQGVNNDPAKAPVMDVQIIDHHFASLLGLKFIAGKNIQAVTGDGVIPEFTEAFTIQDYLLDQPREYLINETAMHQLGWHSAEDAIGQKISWSIGDLALAPGPIVGVVQDFHQETLKNKVDPVVMVQEPIWLRTFLIKVDTENMQASVEKITSVWNELYPFYPMEYYFLDDLYNKLYQGERVQLQLLFLFSGLAIVIAFIGLVGLVAYALKTRTKEIAVRKVLGATIRDLVGLMSREYLVVLLIGSALAVPLSIYGVKEWLSGFAYRVDVSPVSYVITLLLILVLLILTVSVQTVVASRANPAETLRDE